MGNGQRHTEVETYYRWIPFLGSKKQFVSRTENWYVDNHRRYVITRIDSFCWISSDLNGRSCNRNRIRVMFNLYSGKEITCLLCWSMDKYSNVKYLISVAIMKNVVHNCSRTSNGRIGYIDHYWYRNNIWQFVYVRFIRSTAEQMPRIIGAGLNHSVVCLMRGILVSFRLSIFQLRMISAQSIWKTNSTDAQIKSEYECTMAGLKWLETQTANRLLYREADRHDRHTNLISSAINRRFDTQQLIGFKSNESVVHFSVYDFIYLKSFSYS